MPATFDWAGNASPWAGVPYKDPIHCGCATTEGTMDRLGRLFKRRR